MPTQTIGVMSTPPMGWMILRVGIRKGSVGRKTRLKGKVRVSACGYQVRTIRTMNSRIMMPNKGAKIHEAIAAEFINTTLYLRFVTPTSHILTRSGFPKSRAKLCFKGSGIEN